MGEEKNVQEDPLRPRSVSTTGGAIHAAWFRRKWMCGLLVG